MLTAALAFALQSSLANVVSGFHIQADKNFKRGTWVWIIDKDIYVEIVNVGFRYTTLKTMEQYLVFVPTNIMTQNMVHAIGKRGEDPPGVNLKVLLQYSYPPARAMAVLFNTLQDEPGILRDPAPSVRVDWLMEVVSRRSRRFNWFPKQPPKLRCEAIRFLSRSRISSASPESPYDRIRPCPSGNSFGAP